MDDLNAPAAPASAPMRGIGDLGWPSPLLDESIALDPFVSAFPAVDHVALTLKSGTRVKAVCTVPVPGVLRVRIGERPSELKTSPMVLPLPETRASISQGANGVRITGHGVEAFWSSDGQALSINKFHRAPTLALLDGAGRLIGREGPVGWLESIGLAPDCAVYGGGESFQGPNIRGRVRRLINHETHGASGLDLAYLNVPFFWSDAGWGIFLHSSAPVRADLGSTHSEAAALSVEDDCLDMFIMSGNAHEIISQYHQITGLPGRVPAWSLGVWTSRCSYLSASEIEDIIDGYNQAQCPLDVVHVDAWLTDNLIADLACNWTIDRDRYPEGWARKIFDEHGVRTSLWHNPYVMDDSEIGADLRERGLLALAPDGTPARTPDKPDRWLLDLTKPEAVAWWMEQVRRVTKEESIHSFKPDFAEEVPMDASFSDGRSGRQLRNEYALRYQAATHAALSEAMDTEEIMLFCRSGTAGAQRYPCHWVGDTPSTWTGLVTALRACLSLSMSGFAFVAHDIGGFWTPQSIQRVNKAFETGDPTHYEADVDPELFVRWTQWGALSGVMRFHGTGRREPWAYPQPFGQAAVDACRLRDRLRNYLEAISQQASRYGAPLMRPMALAYPDDRAARDADLQYMLGPNILVAPILEPGGRRNVWFPAGRWDPLMGMQPVDGPGWLTVECPLDRFPAWVRHDAPSPVGP